MTGKTEGGKAATLSRIGQRRQVVIPKAIFDRLHLQAGDFMEITTVNGRVSMRRKKPVDADDMLTPAEARKVRHALKQWKAGQTRPWADAKSDLGL